MSDAEVGLFRSTFFYFVQQFFAENILEQGGLEKKITELIRPEIEAMGLTLWGVEIASSQRPVIRIFIDAEDGANIDQCADVSRHLGLMFEVEEIMDSAYVLEVSSPGLERRFFTPQQMTQYTGRKVEATLGISRDGRRRFKGVLEAVGDDSSTLRLADQEEPVELDYENIKKAKLVHEF